MSSTDSPARTFRLELASIRTLPDRLDRLVRMEKTISEFLSAHGSNIALDVAQNLGKQKLDFKKEIAKETASRASMGTSTGKGAAIPKVSKNTIKKSMVLRPRKNEKQQCHCCK